MFDEILSEISAEMAPFRSQIVDAETVRVGLALARQKRIAWANARMERCFMEGLGEVVATIDADIYFRFGHLYGFETVNSPDFLRTLLRDNEDLRVRSRSRLARIVVPFWEARDEAEHAELPIGAGVCTEAQSIQPGEMLAA